MDQWKLNDLTVDSFISLITSVEKVWRPLYFHVYRPTLRSWFCSPDCIFIVELRDCVLYTCCNYRILLQTCVIMLTIKNALSYLERWKKAYDINKMELKRNMIKLLFFRTEITPGYHLERFKEVDILQCQNKGKQVSGRKFQLIQMNFLRKLSRWCWNWQSLVLN